MIHRELEDTIRGRIGAGKAIIIMGPRQVGKSTLLHSIFDADPNALWIDADNIGTQMTFEDATSEMIHTIIGNHKVVIIDEAQNLSNAGLTLKRITDYISDVQLVATGSSSFELADKIKEALTGRKWEYRLYPISFSEMSHTGDILKETSMLEHRMVYGYYPEVVSTPGDEKAILSSLASDYLYKDIIKIDGIKKTDRLVRLLRALALQIGSQVSYNEVAQTCGLDPKTIEKYIDILEQSYIVFRLGSFSRNMRNELKKSKKIYFYDLGIRNAILNNFTPFANRDDHERGGLWENFLITERLKHCEYNRIIANRYFWRTKDNKEIDYIEEYDGILHTYEFKLKKDKESQAINSFKKAYPNSTHEIINISDFQQFII